jgi:hypothetical protein
MSRGRPPKYFTDEERLEAKRARAREWKRRNKDRITEPTYAEKIANMTMEEYVAFRQKRLEQQNAYLQRKKEATV